MMNGPVWYVGQLGSYVLLRAVQGGVVIVETQFALAEAETFATQILQQVRMLRTPAIIQKPTLKIVK